MRRRLVVDAHRHGSTGLKSVTIAIGFIAAGAAALAAGCIGSEPQLDTGGDAASGSDATGMSDVATDDVTGDDVTTSDAAPSDAFTSDACTPCGAECVNVASDPRNCGSCGNACAPGAACNAGTCSSSCSTGLVNCGGACIDPKTSNQHCGASGQCGAGDAGSAGTTCAAGQLCSAGACVQTCSAAQPTACPTANPTYCTNTNTDPSNCGGCNQPCAAGAACVSGQCQCPTQEPNPCGSGASQFCTNEDTDPQNCGGCGNACKGGFCFQGACSCFSPETFCGVGGSTMNGICADLATDPSHCGACGVACLNGSTVCSGGKCQCPAGDPCQTGADPSNHCDPGTGTFVCSCDGNNGWRGKGGCFACYHAYTVLGSNSDCDPSETPYAQPTEPSLEACYQACASSTDPNNNNAPCQFFAFYGPGSVCNLTSKCGSRGTPQSADVLYQLINGIPPGGDTTCP